MLFAEEALEDSRMFAIDWNERNFMMSDKFIYQRSSDNEDFFISESDIFFAFNGFESRLEPGKTNEGINK